MNRPDLVGQTFGRLTVIEFDHSRNGHCYWKCRCACGSERMINTASLMSGNSRSCGCLRKDGMIGTHFSSKTREYRIWIGIKARCTNPNLPFYKNYGGRGITICDEWKEDFVAFYNHIGPCPSPGFSVDRIDNDKGYEPGNVQWADRKTQLTNKRTNVFVEFNGIRQTLAQWSRETGIPEKTLSYRHEQGWTPDRILTPPKPRRKT